MSVGDDWKNVMRILMRLRGSMAPQSQFIETAAGMTCGSRTAAVCYTDRSWPVWLLRGSASTQSGGLEPDTNKPLG